VVQERKKTWYVQIDRKQVRLSKDKAEAMRMWRRLMAGRRTINGLRPALTITCRRSQRNPGGRGSRCSIPSRHIPGRSRYKTKNKTGVKKRPIYLTPELAEPTRTLIGGRAEGHLFLNLYGDPWTTDTVRCRFRNLRETLGLSRGVIPYGTRHRFASDAINRRKMDSLVVARLMGHSDGRMLQQTYFREDTDAMVEAMKKAAGR
jgi:Phage integrase family